MKYPKIEYLTITVAPNYVHYNATYESGKVMCKYRSGDTFSNFLYPFDFLRESKSVTHIMQQLCVHKIMPMSFNKWIYEDHPQCQFQVNPFDNEIITITFATEKYALLWDRIEY